MVTTQQFAFDGEVSPPTPQELAAATKPQSALRLRARILRHPALRIAAVATMVVGSVFITLGSRVYFNDEELPPFVVEKLPLRFEGVVPAFEDLWLKALQVHVIAAAFALPGCLLLISRTVLRRARALHRILGRVVGVVVLFALVPSGLVLALEAKGGAPVAVGFVLSGLIVAVGMVVGIVTARRGDIVSHRRAVLHVLAQLSVAVTSRAMLFGLDAASVDAELAYLVSLWVPVVASAWLVERLSVRSRPAVTPVERKRHEGPDAVTRPAAGLAVEHDVAGQPA